MVKTLGCIVLVASAVLGFGQTAKRLERNGDAEFAQGRYLAAYQSYLAAFEKQAPRQPSLGQKLARVADTLLVRDQQAGLQYALAQDTVKLVAVYGHAYGVLRALEALQVACSFDTLVLGQGLNEAMDVLYADDYRMVNALLAQNRRQAAYQATLSWAHTTPAGLALRNACAAEAKPIPVALLFTESVPDMFSAGYRLQLSKRFVGYPFLKLIDREIFERVNQEQQRTEVDPAAVSDSLEIAVGGAQYALVVAALRADEVVQPETRTPRVGYARRWHTFMYQGKEHTEPVFDTPVSFEEVSRDVQFGYELELRLVHVASGQVIRSGLVTATHNEKLAYNYLKGHDPAEVSLTLRPPTNRPQGAFDMVLGILAPGNDRHAFATERPPYKDPGTLRQVCLDELAQASYRYLLTWFAEQEAIN
ncbi:MAG: hypothetical protein SFY70_00890 [Bacteroidia bacterium]|nr:hypothetical protein [Bacteroidia bacterium]